MQLKKNILIQLFDSTGMISERMVQQGPEFYNGPKEKHKGPMRISFTVEDQEDVIGVMGYLEQLALQAPLKSNKSATRVSKDTSEVDLDNSLEVVLEEAIKAAKGDQDKFIQHLRGLDFVFLDSAGLKLKIPESYSIKKRHLESYQWLIRISKIAKDPRNDKYDPQLLIGISIFEERVEKMVVYLYGEMYKTLKIALPAKKAMDYTKTNLIKYPHYMNEDERFKWGVEHRLLFNDPNKPMSKFYRRWVKDVKVGDELKLNRNE